MIGYRLSAIKSPLNLRLSPTSLGLTLDSQDYYATHSIEVTSLSTKGIEYTHCCDLEAFIDFHFAFANSCFAITNFCSINYHTTQNTEVADLNTRNFIHLTRIDRLSLWLLDPLTFVNFFSINYYATWRIEVAGLSTKSSIHSIGINRQSSWLLDLLACSVLDLPFYFINESKCTYWRIYYFLQLSYMFDRCPIGAITMPNDDLCNCSFWMTWWLVDLDFRYS